MNSFKKIRHIFRSSALESIWKWSKPVRCSVGIICLIGIVSTLCSLAVPLVTKRLVDGATASNASALWIFGSILAGLMLLQRLLSIYTSFLRNTTSARFQRTMQGMVTDAILGKEYASLKAYHSGELTNRVFSDASVVRNGIMNMLPMFIRTALSFIGAAIILITMDWWFFPVIIAVSIVGLAFTMLFREPMKQRHKRMQAAEDALHASTQETLENVKLVKASVSEERASASMDEHREQLYSEQIRNGRLSIIMNQGMSSVFGLSWLVFYLWGCIKIYHGDGFTYGSLAALLQLVGRIQGPISSAVSMVAQAYGVVASAERLQEVVGLPDEAQGEKIDDFDEIRLGSVCFQYEDGAEEVLIDVSGTIHKGDFVALTGISGGGKTSLFQLLLGIYKPTGGSVMFRSGEMTIPASKGTRSLFAYVPQGNTLMSGTLRDNLTMFTDRATDEAIEDAIHAACLDELVKETGLDARIGERGVGLSEGQAQRVAIARALLSGAPILLLDESTSALDESTEARLLNNINHMRDKTVIIVTHRRAALAICDYTLNISGGRMTLAGGVQG